VSGRVDLCHACRENWGKRRRQARAAAEPSQLALAGPPA
jgi:hypothetical protein